MNHERWHKKDVTLTWNTRRTSFAVAQELFSSHDVDAGSKLLLRSLDVTTLPVHGHAIDFGCGYGVLGLAIRDVLTGWTVDLIDRDALAAAFSLWNAERLGFDDGSVRCMVGLGIDVATETGADLILWNVPGKAGENVLRHLAEDVADALVEGGLAVLVVVNPLAEVIRDALIGNPDIDIVADTDHAEHTVIHARKTGAANVPGDPFDRGVFDRELAGFGVDDSEYDITSVVGIPEYDSYSFATQVVFDVLRTVVIQVESVIVMRPGQGHAPLVVANQFQPARLTMVDRDQLLGSRGCRAPRASNRDRGRARPCRRAIRGTVLPGRSHAGRPGPQRDPHCPAR
jgi:16S rRNA (guanine1207-N2)-methyltransferase